jgi:hypothetical protein
MGGLGNQLFIYFAGLYLSKKTNSKLVCDLSYLDSDRTKHGVSITSFILEGDFVKQSKSSLYAIKLINGITTRLSHNSSLFKRIHQKITSIYLSTGIGYDPELENIHKNVTLKGYFQTWRYVRALEEIHELKLKIQNPSAWFTNLAAFAEQIRPIVLHVRQGDYHEDVNAFIGVLGPNYYRNALIEIRKAGITKPVWVFSDDIDSAKNILGLDFDENIKWIVAPIGTDSAEELAIMQFGSAHIIANSTFSWWGAYLSQSTKMVIAPEFWFKGEKEPLDLIPPDWKRIENDWL